jgi:glycosyltransferase involved in cell wall biosynthesis/protein-tyrosine-phosphatase
MSADLWAGAEVQVATVCGYLARDRKVQLSAVLFNDGRLADELRRSGVDLAIVDEQRHSAVQIVRFLARFLQTRQVEIVHTHRYKDNILGAAAAKLAGVRHVIRTVHGLTEPAAGWNRVKVRAADALDTAILRHGAARVIAVSAGVAQTLRQSGCRPASVIGIPNGIDLSRVRATRTASAVRRELGIAADALVIGTAGRLVPVKAQASLLGAARLVLEQRRDARFVIAGDGPLRDDLILAARALGIASQCVFTGSRADIHEVMAAMDVFVLPSLHEGIPMALLEAMALRRPVVATAVGGMVEVIDHRSNGLLVAPRDERGLASACLEVAADPDLARGLGETARQTVERRFSRDANGAAVLATYRAVMRAPDTVSISQIRTLTLCRELMRGLTVHVWRTLSHRVEAARERRRMTRIRRKPAALVTALRSAARVLIVCHGNIIRSPFAAALVARYVASGGAVSISSAGLAAVPGKPPHPTALQLAAALGLDLSAHAASPLDADVVAESDAIFVMDVPQLLLMRQRFPEARSKTFLLACLASDTPLEIRDPYGGDESRFQACFAHISSAVRPLVHAIAGAQVRP